jgi:hypothetical protein
MLSYRARTWRLGRAWQEGWQYAERCPLMELLVIG